jgi:hypothetical protein
MLLIIFVGIEALVFLVYLVYARFYFLLSSILFFLYLVFKLIDGDEYTGYRQWTTLRNWTVWRHTSAVRYFWGNKEAFTERPSQRLLFVVMGNATNMGLFSGFGLHGGIFSSLDVVYMLPGILFRIPLLRDLLLWTGAVAAGIDAEGTILELLKRGRSVAYCPSGMRDILQYTDPTVQGEQAQQVLVQKPSKGIFEFARQHKIFLVPVMISGEAQRYSFYKSHRVHSMQQRALDWCGWPFPLMFVPKVLGAAPPPRLALFVGTPMDPSVQQDVDSFYRLFFGQVQGLSNVGTDQTTIQIAE